MNFRSTQTRVTVRLRVRLDRESEMVIVLLTYSCSVSFLYARTTLSAIVVVRRATVLRLASVSCTNELAISD